jgi:hypothetical protein
MDMGYGDLSFVSTEEKNILGGIKKKKKIAFHVSSKNCSGIMVNLCSYLLELNFSISQVAMNMFEVDVTV